MIKRLFNSLRQQKYTLQDTKNVASMYQHLLKTGLYTVTPEIVYRDVNQLSPHLLKYRHTQKQEHRWLATPKQAIKRAYFSGADRIRLKGTGEATILAKRKNKDPVFIAPESGKVIKPFPAWAKPDHYNKIRAEISGILPTPKHRLVSGGTILEEQYLQGVSLEEMPCPEATRIVKNILSCIFMAQRDSLRAPDQTLFTKATSDPNLDRRVQDDLLSLCNMDNVYRLFDAPCLPAHGDLAPDNIIVANSKPLVIDLEPKCVGHWPCWLDAAFLLLNYDCAGYWRGDYDFEISTLLNPTKIMKSEYQHIHTDLAVATLLLSHLNNKDWQRKWHTAFKPARDAFLRTPFHAGASASVAP